MSVSLVHSYSTASLARERILERNFEVIYQRCYALKTGGEKERIAKVYGNGISQVVTMHFWVDTEGSFFFNPKTGEPRRQVTVSFGSNPYRSLMEIFYRVPGHECRTFPGLMPREFDKATARVDDILEAMRERVDRHFVEHSCLVKKL